MAEEIVPTPNMEQAPVPMESDLDRLAGEIAKHKENPEMAGASEHEMVKQAIKSITAAPAPAPKVVSDEDSQLPAYMSESTPATKLEVENLVSTAFREGISKAAAEAAKSSPFVLDAFHDTLAGRMHEELKKRNII